MRNARPRTGRYKLSDGGGLFLEVNPTSSRIWRMSYVQASGKKNVLTFGAYPAVSLADASAKRAEAKKLIAAGTDPAQARRVTKQLQEASASHTFEAIAREWHANKAESWKESTSTNVLRRLERDIFPLIGKHPIADIRAPVMLDALRQIEKRGALEMARRCAQFSGQVFRYAIATGRAEVDPIPSLRGALKPRAKGHHPAITPDELP